MTSFKARVPMVFVTANQPEWKTLKDFWTEGTQKAVDPATGLEVTLKVVKVKVPLGLTQAPPVPGENAMTVEKWVLGKSSTTTISSPPTARLRARRATRRPRGSATARRFRRASTATLGPINSPTVFNSAYNRFQFWDGRASTLEDQSQGPVGNAKEMFGGKNDPWLEAVERIRANPEYVKAFVAVFGHAPTRDSAAKAIATYERTVLVGNSLHDKAEAAMRKRVVEEETGKFVLKAEDYASRPEGRVRRERLRGQGPGFGPREGRRKGRRVRQALLAGRDLFFGKARCSNCHTGDTFTDHTFHNLGIGATPDGDLPLDEFGRFVRLATGHKDTTFVGAFKTPGTRGLLQTTPYMHSGEEKTLEAVVDFYDRGGNVNAWLDEKMRDTAAEVAYLKARAEGKPVDPAVKTYGPAKKPIIPLKLNLSAAGEGGPRAVPQGAQRRSARPRW